MSKILFIMPLAVEWPFTPIWDGSKTPDSNLILLWIYFLYDVPLALCIIVFPDNIIHLKFATQFRLRTLNLFQSLINL